MKEWIDISVPISPQMVVWPGVPKPEFTVRRSLSGGDDNNDSNIFINCHHGTHVDAPFHFFANGPSIDKVPLGQLIGKAYVCDTTDSDVIGPDILMKAWPRGEAVQRVLFKTKNSRLWQEDCQEFVKDFCALTAEGARWLLEKGVEVVGIDYLSVQRYHDSPLVHQLLLDKNVALVEGLDLTMVQGGWYELFCLPIKLTGLEAAPARALLRKI